MARTFLILALAYIGVFEQASAQVLPPPLHLTVVLHNEEPGGGRPDYTADRNFYLQNRKLVKLLAETITSKSASFNFQSDWNYLKAAAMFDTGSVTSNTAGKNIVRWMYDNLGIEIDPHAHETQYNYADVAYLIEQLGVAPSKNVGGFLYYPPDNPQGWEKHINGLQGKVYPAYFWRADNLWGAATLYHQGPDDRSYGIWRPKDRYNFYQHDSTQRLLNIGGGCGDYQGVWKILEYISSGRAPAEGFYTANVMMIQDWMTESSIQELGNFIDSLSGYVTQGRIRWRTLTQMSQLWKSEYNGKPFRIDCTALPTGIESISSEIPSSFELRQNYPNPFNPTTTIRFLLSQTPHNPPFNQRGEIGRFVTLKVFDVLGREVATLVDGELNAGKHSVVFNAQGMPSGVYFYRLRAAGFIQTKKMLISK